MYQKGRRPKLKSVPCARPLRGQVWISTLDDAQCKPILSHNLSVSVTDVATRYAIWSSVAMLGEGWHKLLFCAQIISCLFGSRFSLSLSGTREAEHDIWATLKMVTVMPEAVHPKCDRVGGHTFPNPYETPICDSSEAGKGLKNVWPSLVRIN